jgi:hypothetical protein
MKRGMLPFWKDGDSSRRLQAISIPPDRCFGAEMEAAFMSLINQELLEGIIVKIDRAQVKHCSPTFPVKKKKKKDKNRKDQEQAQVEEFRKVPDCQILNSEQRPIHFKMDGPTTVQETALDWD